MLPSSHKTPTTTNYAKGNQKDAVVRRAERAPLFAPHAHEYGAKAKSTNEETTGSRPWWNILLFEWFSPLVELGNTRHFTASDLFSISDEQHAIAIAPRFASLWADACSRHGKRASVLLTLAEAFGLRFAALTVAQLIHATTAVLVPPLLTMAIMQYSADPAASAVRGLLYALAVAVGGVFPSLAHRHLDYLGAELAMLVQTAVSTAAFKHALVVSPSTLQRASPGDIVEHVTTDATRLRNGLLAVGTVVGTVFQATFGGILLYSLIGKAVWAGIAAWLIGMGCLVFAGKIARRHEEPLKEAKEKRMQLSQELIVGMKELKLLTWERVYAEQIDELKHIELRHLKQLLLAKGCVTWLTAFVPVLVFVSVVVAYALLVEGSMDAATALPALMLTSLLLRDALFPLPRQVVLLRDARMGLNRLNEFLTEPERVMANDPHPTRGVYVVVKNADFKWDTRPGKTELDLLLEAQGIGETPTTGPVLHRINFYAESGEVHAVVGGTESGKSSFLAGIVGLARCTAGDVSVHGSVAYITCDPFLLDATIRDNICFGQPYEADRYFRAIQASCLKSDLPLFPQGDRSEIGGEHGVNLSTAQRIRIALARSVYQNADIYVLDGVLSAMDRKVAKKVFRKYIQTALKGKIVIMATQSLHFAKKCRNIIVLAQGTIVEAGDFKSLIANKKWSILAQVVHSGPSKMANTEVMITKDAESSDEADEDSDSDEISAQTSLAEFAPIVGENASEPPSVDDDSGDENVRTAVALWLLRSLGEDGYLMFGLLAAIHLVASVFRFFLWSSIASVDTPSHLVERYATLSGLYVLTTIVAAATQLHSCVYASQCIHRGLVHRLCRAPMAFFHATPNHRIVWRVSKDLVTLEAELASSWPLLLRSSTQLLIIAGVVVDLSPWLVLALAPIILGGSQLDQCFRKLPRDLQQLDVGTSAALEVCVAEVLRGMATIRNYKADHLFIRKFEHRRRSCNQVFMFKVWAESWLGIRVDLLCTSLVAGVALAAIHVHKSSEEAAQYQAARTGVAVAFAFGLSPVLFGFIKSCDAARNMLVAGGRIKAYTKLPIEAALEAKIELRPQEGWPPAAAIEFDNVSVRYRQGFPRILRGVSFTVNGGSSVAIVGGPGSGKRSIFAALTRLVESATGAISIDGVDISKVGLHDLRSKMSVFSPDPVLFAGSIRSNLDATHQFTDEEIWSAIKKAQLQGAILSLDETVNERGSNYSSGERQLLCIARAILRRPRIVMIEESDHVDTGTESEQVDRCLQEEFSGATRLTITQRTATAMAASKVLIMVNGQIAELGTSKELQKNSKSLFRSILDEWKRRDRKKT